MPGVLLLVLLLWPVAALADGFGSETPGGAGQPVYRVTTLRDGGPGSLRDAVSQGHRDIRFEVAGEIALGSDLWVRGAYLTIDGTTAPAPGITLKHRAVVIHGSEGAHDVIVRGLRSRHATGCDQCPGAIGNGFGIGTDTYHVVLDRVSVQGFDDQAISVGRGAHDITIQWSIFAEGKNSQHNLPVIIAGESKDTGRHTRRVSFHHNLIIKGYERMPHVALNTTGEQASELQVDIRNNLLWDWGYAATQVWRGAKANVINNYYYDPDAGFAQQQRAIFFRDARAHIAGNISGHGPELTRYLNRLGNETEPFPSSPVLTSDACTAAFEVLGNAGVRPLDRIDARYVRSVDKLRGCDQRPLDGPLLAPVGLRIE